MIGNGSLVYWYHKTIYSSSHHINDNGISDDEIIEVSTVDVIFRHRYIGTSHCSSQNCGFYHSSGDGKYGLRYQETIHYLYCNHGVYRFVVGGRGVTRYQ